MVTQIFSTMQQDLAKAADIIREGGLVAFPTETVYGLGADALNADAVAAIYEAKGRPSDNPMIVHIAALEDMDKLTSELSDDARTLMEKFWPGPLTMVVRKKTVFPTEPQAALIQWR